MFFFLVTWISWSVLHDLYHTLSCDQFSLNIFFHLMCLITSRLSSLLETFFSNSCDNILNFVKLWYETVMDGCHHMEMLLDIRNYFSGFSSNIFFKDFDLLKHINPNDLVCFLLSTQYIYIYIITTSKLLCQNCLTIVFFLSYNHYSNSYY